jgi:hypothetical protein
MARLETPVARATSDRPPLPWAALCAAAHNRRARSSQPRLQLGERLLDLTLAGSKNILCRKWFKYYTYFITAA